MKSKRKPRESLIPTGSGAYRQGIRQADEIIAKHVVSEANPNRAEIPADNWQQLALDWFAPHEPESSA